MRFFGQFQPSWDLARVISHKDADGVFLLSNLPLKVGNLGRSGVHQLLGLPHIQQGIDSVLLERLRVYFRWRRPADWLFPSKQRQDLPLDDASIRVLCRKAGHRAGIRRRVHPHLFRHACATHMLDAGADLRTIQVLLGHGDIRTTAKYLRVSLQRLQSIQSPFDTLNVKPLDRSEDDRRQK